MIALGFMHAMRTELPNVDAPALAGASFFVALNRGVFWMGAHARLKREYLTSDSR